MDLIARNGKSSMAPMNLNTTSKVKPTIRKGSRSSQISGKRKINSKATGQHSTNNMHHNKTAINVLISRTVFVPLVQIPFQNIKFS